MSDQKTRLRFSQVLGYGLGHVFNDICASLWFTYLLLFLQKVLSFDSSSAGLVLLTGQLADGASTTLVGLIADRVAQALPLCRSYGRRKSWHLLGSLCVAVSFPFIFLPCLLCSPSTSPGSELVYYIFFVVVFQFGWAATQISHLALITDLTGCQDERTSLTAIRYGFTVAATISVYSITWLFLGIEGNKDISQDDQPIFRWIMVTCMCLGVLSSLGFHLLVREQAPGQVKGQQEGLNMGEKNTEIEDNGLEAKSLGWWLQRPILYLVGGVYMATRLFLNLCQAYIPFYLQDSLGESSSTVGTVPLVMFAASFITSFPTKLANKYLGRSLTWLVGAGLGCAASITVYLANGPYIHTWGVYLVAAAFGASSSVLLITSLGMTADLIGAETSSSALVFGLMSLTDKVANGLGIVLIQSIVPCLRLYAWHPMAGCPVQPLAPTSPPDMDLSGTSTCITFYRDVLFISTGSSSLFGAAMVGLILLTAGLKNGLKTGLK